MSDLAVQILRRADDQLLAATLRHGLRPEDLIALESEWGPHRAQLKRDLLRLGIPKSEWPESLHWDWGSKGPELKLLESSGYALHCEGRCHGAMLTKTASYSSRLDKGRPLVYVDYLEAAPWNWNVAHLNQRGEFRGVGSLLFLAALRQSVAEGFHGRIGLHALPQAESFYEGPCRMTALGRDPNKQNLRYFELTRSEAEKHLGDGGEP